MGSDKAVLTSIRTQQRALNGIIIRMQQKRAPISSVDRRRQKTHVLTHTDKKSLPLSLRLFPLLSSDHFIYLGGGGECELQLRLMPQHLMHFFPSRLDLTFRY